MFFEEQLGIRPSEWQVWAPVDEFLAGNGVPRMAIEDSVVQRTGVHVAMLRLMIASCASILAGFLHRFVPTATGRHLFSLVTGVALLYYPYGNQVVLTVVPALAVYATMVVAPKSAGHLSWGITFGWLLLCMEWSGDAWDQGAADIMGSLMVLTLKLVATAYNLSDSFSRAATSLYAPNRKPLLMSTPPNLFKYLAYVYAYGNLLSGPFNEYKDYEAFTARSGAWRQVFLIPGMFRACMVACMRSALTASCGLLANRLLESGLESMALTAPKVWEYTIWQRYVMAFMKGMSRRAIFYYVWGMHEAAINASGYGFSGYKDREKQHPEFTRGVNVSILHVETCTSMAVLPRAWNIKTGHFLRHYLYERLGCGFRAMAVTQLVSGVWHGLREGHMLYFAMHIPMFHASKVMYKQESRLPGSITHSLPWLLLKWFMAHTGNNVFALAHLFEKWSLILPAWQAFYFAPHAFVAFWCVAGLVLPVPDRRKSDPVVPSTQAGNRTRKAKATAAEEDATKISRILKAASGAIAKVPRGVGPAA